VDVGAIVGLGIAAVLALFVVALVILSR